jgi:hypothetical protein
MTPTPRYTRTQGLIGAFWLLVFYAVFLAIMYALAWALMIAFLAFGPWAALAVLLATLALASLGS